MLVSPWGPLSGPAKSPRVSGPKGTTCDVLLREPGVGGGSVEARPGSPDLGVAAGVSLEDTSHRCLGALRRLLLLLRATASRGCPHVLFLSLCHGRCWALAFAFVFFLFLFILCFHAACFVAAPNFGVQLGLQPLPVRRALARGGGRAILGPGQVRGHFGVPWTDVSRLLGRLCSLVVVYHLVVYRSPFAACLLGASFTRTGG